jgi:hypothetical protein
VSESDQGTAVNAMENAVSTELPEEDAAASNATANPLSGPKAAWYSLQPISATMIRHAGYWSI